MTDVQDISNNRAIIGIPATLNALIGVTPTTVSCGVSPTFPGCYRVAVPNTVTLVSISPVAGQIVQIDNSQNSSDVQISPGGAGLQATVLAGDVTLVWSNNSNWYGGDTGGGSVVNPLFTTARVRGVIDANVPNLASFAVSGAGRDGITYLQNDIVLLTAQTTAAQNGPYVVGAVVAGNAPLTRPGWWATGSIIPQNFGFNVGDEGTVYHGYLAATADTVNKVVDTDDPRIILRNQIGYLAAASQPTWNVDSVSGNDSNDGSTNPLRTVQEIARRWGLNPTIRQATTINILSPFLATGDRIAFSGLNTTRLDRKLIIKGLVTAGASIGAITAVSAINHALQDGGLYVTVGATNWTGITRVRISGGARDGAVAYVTKPNTAAGQARMTPFAIVPSGTWFENAGMQVTPQVGDTLIQESVTATTDTGNTTPSPVAILGGNCPVVLEDLDCRDDAFTTGQIFDRGSNFFEACTRCQMGGATRMRSGAQPVFNTCLFNQQVQNQSAGNPNLLGCGVLAGGFVGYGTVGLDTQFQNCNISAFNNGLPGVVNVGSVGVYDIASASTPALSASFGGKINLYPQSNDGGVQYGTGNAGVKLQVTDGGNIWIAVAANVLLAGAAGNTKVSGIIRASLFSPIDSCGCAIRPLDQGTATTDQNGLSPYPVAVARTARNVSLANVANLAAFTVAGNDGVTNVQGDIVVLLAQTTPAQNGPYLVGVVGGGTAPLTRPDWWQAGMLIPQGFEISIGAESTVYAGATLKADAATATKVVDTDDPILIPDRIVQQVVLVNGTVDITNVPIRAAGKVACTISRTTANTTAATIQYNPSTITAGELGSGTPKVTVQAQIAAGTINNADLSTLNVAIIQ